MKVKRIEMYDRKWHTGAALRKHIRWTIVDENEVQRDGLFKTKKDAERALRVYAS